MQQNGKLSRFRRFSPSLLSKIVCVIFSFSIENARSNLDFLLKQEKNNNDNAIEKKQGRWKSGESGNPNGRKPGTGKIAKLRESIAEHMPEIISQMVSKAKEGYARQPDY